MYNHELLFLPTPASLSLGLIVGISVGVTSLLLIALFIILVLVCVMCRICIHGKRSYKPKSGMSIH